MRFTVNNRTLILLVVLFFLFSSSSVVFFVISNRSVPYEEATSPLIFEPVVASDSREQFPREGYVIMQNSLTLFNVDIDGIYVEDDYIIIDTTAHINEKKVLLCLKSVNFFNVEEYVLRESTELRDSYESVGYTVTKDNFSTIEISSGYIFTFNISTEEFDVSDYLEELITKDTSERILLKEEFVLSSITGSGVVIP